MFKPVRKKPRQHAIAQQQRAALNPELVSMFLTLQEKLESPVFNGGFDELKTSVHNVNEKIDNIAQKIYEPDDGLFSRIKTISSAQGQMKSDITSMSETLKIVVSLQSDVKTLLDWKDSLSKKIWILIPALITVFAKVGMDIFAAHIVLK